MNIRQIYELAVKDRVTLKCESLNFYFEGDILSASKKLATMSLSASDWDTNTWHNYFSVTLKWRKKRRITFLTMKGNFDLIYHDL